MNPELARLREWADIQFRMSSLRENAFIREHNDTSVSVETGFQAALTLVIEQIDALPPARPLRAEEITEPGYYWYNVNGENEFLMVRVNRFHHDDTWAVYTVNGCFGIRSYPGVFYGPLTPPQQGEGQG